MLNGLMYDWMMRFIPGPHGFSTCLVLLFVSAYYLQQDLGQQARVFQMVASVSVRGKVVPPFCDGREHCSPHVCSTEIFNVCQQFHFVTLNQHELQSTKNDGFESFRFGLF